MHIHLAYGRSLTAKNLGNLGNLGTALQELANPIQAHEIVSSR